MDSQEYLKNFNPRALRWALQLRFQHSQLSDLAHIVKLVHENGLEIQKTQIQKANKIDRGSFGSIFKASYQGRVCVLKTIGQGGSQAISEIIHSVFLELHAIAGLNHPRVVKLEGMITYFPDEFQRDQQAELGFLLEYCENGNLYDNIFKKGTLSHLPNRIAIASEVSEGMTYLHANRIIHRDLSSLNIVLDRDMHAKICDFGCARKIGPSGHIKPTTISGSPAYMSPEQLTGASELTLKSDVWAMGILLWEILTMQIPWATLLADVNDHNALALLVVKQRKRLPPLPDGCLPSGAHQIAAKLLERAFTEDSATRIDMQDFHAGVVNIQQILVPPSAVSTAAMQETPQIMANAGMRYQVAPQEIAVVDRKRPHSNPKPPTIEPAVGDSRGICPVCGQHVTTAHQGRTKNTMGVYFHVECWQQAQDVVTDPSLVSPNAPARMRTAAPPASLEAGIGSHGRRPSFRGNCPLCKSEVNTSHEGRRSDTEGRYWHGACWEAQEQQGPHGAIARVPSTAADGLNYGQEWQM